MARTCIICGGPTGSREHIFPAALGGRRTNKGIYCADHNNEYSGLAGIIAGQLALFNAQIGVIGDHASETKPVTMTDLASGREVVLTNLGVRFKDPQIISQQPVGETVVAKMAFNSRKEATAWALEQQARGITVQSTTEGEKTSYHLGTAHKTITLGGNEEGLRAIGYIAQTFLAHSFPDVARLPQMKGIKEYTLTNTGSDFVWWDFDPPDDLPANKFPFGHRVIVGLNKDDGTAYARLSLFSTLNFAILFGTIAVTASKSVITDIDPLAQSPPHDILSWTEEAAKSPVSKPANLNASLREAISSGRAQSGIIELMRRIVDFERQTAAKKLLEKITGAAALAEGDRDKLFTDVVSSESQRVFKLMSHVANDFKSRAHSPIERHLSGLIDKAVALDPLSANGLTKEASESLSIACEALKTQMSQDFNAGILDQDRMEMLIGGGAGAHAVATAILQPIIMTFPDR